MADSDWLAAAFEEHREHLRVVAYRSGLPARSPFPVRAAGSCAPQGC
jgi:hypothetical protein